MKPPPPFWPRISATLFYEDAAKAIDWLCAAFGFEVQLKVEGASGSIEHSELVYGEGLVMVGQVGRRDWFASPRSQSGKCTGALFVYVDDIEAHCERAREKGATITDEISTHDYGDEYWTDRSYGALDLEGHRWWFAQRIRSSSAPYPRSHKHET